MPATERPDPARCVGPIIDGVLQAFQPSGRASWGSMSLLRSAELCKSTVSAGDRATRPRWYSGVWDTVLGLALSSRATGWVTVKRRGTWWFEGGCFPSSGRKLS